MMCSYAGVAEHEDVKYEVWQRPRGRGWIAPEWERRHKPKLREHNAFAQLPYVLNGDTGDLVVGSLACYSYLGRSLGLCGSTSRERTQCEQVVFYVHSMQMEFFDLCYPFKGNKDATSFVESLAPHFEVALPSHYEKLESWLQGRLGDWPPFFAAPSPCVADFVAWEVVDHNEALARAYNIPSPLADFEALGAHYERFRSLPRLMKYFASYDATLPVNNKMAFALT